VEWWQVDVVLRLASGTDADGEVVLNHLRDALAAMEEPDGQSAFRGVRSTYSYDVAPPEGSVGTSFWIRARSGGAAADAGLALVQTACREVIGQELPVWDLRLMPLDAMLSRTPDIQPLTRHPS